jgi:hypothetical protein
MHFISPSTEHRKNVNAITTISTKDTSEKWDFELNLQ